MSNYEAWRISYQSSEQAARAAFNTIDTLRARVAELEAALLGASEEYIKLRKRSQDIEAERDQLAKDALQKIANDTCGRIPEGFVASICFDSGAAYCELVDCGVGGVVLPDAADKSVYEQLQDAIDAAIKATRPAQGRLHESSS